MSGASSATGRPTASPVAAAGPGHEMARGPAVRTPVAKPAPTAVPATARRAGRLSKDAYRRQKVVVDGDLTRLGLRKNHLELAMGDRAIRANFVELRRIASELADVEVALAAAEQAWLELEERAP